MLTTITLKNASEFKIGNVLAYNSIFKTWSIEHYSKCSFRCAYCCFDSQGKSVATVDPDKLIPVLANDINNAIDTGLFIPGQTKIILSCLTDPYVDQDAALLLTRHIIQYLVSIHQPFIIGTRGVLIERDFDLLQSYGTGSEVHFSLPVINPDYIKKFEPHVPAIEQRISTIQAAHKAGIHVTVRIDPWIPGATDVEAILQCLPKNIDILVSPLLFTDTLIIGEGVDATDPLQTVNADKTSDPLFNKYQGFTQHGFCRTATKLFSHLSQSDINREYIKERNRIGFRRKVKWYYPPMSSANIQDLAHRFLKPDELS